MTSPGTATSSAAPGRVYGGQTAQQRAATRRQQLLDAGLELFGTQGFRATTLRGICREAGLSERYFYESFRSTEEVLRAVYAQVCERVAVHALAALEEADGDFATQAQVGMRAFAEATLADTRAARVQLLEAVGVSEELEAERRAVLHRFADIATSRIAGTSRGGLDPRVLGMMLVGATNELLIDHHLGLSPVDVDSLVEHVVHLALALGALADGQRPSP